MKKTFKYSLLSLASTLIMASCGKDDIEPTPGNEDIKINITSLNDFKTGMSQINDDSKTYKAFVLQDLATDSLGLAETLAEWKKFDEGKANLQTDWGTNGIFADKERTVYAMEDYIAAGKPKIKANPTSGLMPYAASVQDSLDYKKLGVELKIRRDGKVITVESVNGFKEIIEQLASENKPVSIDVDGTLNVNNTDSKVLETVLDQIISNPNISTQGNIEVAASTDSVAVTSGFIQKLQAVNGKIKDNGANAMFIEKIENPEVLRTVLENGAKVRTGVSENFANTDIAVPNKIVYRTPALKTRSGATNEVDFSTGIKALPARGATWKSQNYLLDTGDSEIEIRDETALARISQPAVRGTKEFPNPDIYTEENPKYGTIYLDETKMWSDSTNIAIAQRVRGAGGRTKIRTKSLSSNDKYSIRHFHEPKNIINMSPDGTTKVETILLNINDNNLPLNYPIYAEHADLQVTTYSIDVQKYCFVVPESLGIVSSDIESVQIENDRKVIKLIEGNGIISVTNRMVNEGGIGILPQRKSLFWLTPAEYAYYASQGKEPR